MGGALQRIQGAKLLLGEGDEEVRFFNSLLKHLGITDIQVEPTRGKDEMARVLKGLRDRPGFLQLSSMGVTRDADDDAERAFQSVCDALHRADFVAPRAMMEPGTGPIRVRVFVFPDCRSPGMLETLCLNSVADDKALPCLDQYFACVEREAARRPENLWKARVHAWLASQDKPGLRLGEAGEKGYWPFNQATFDPLCAFLRTL